MCVCVLVNVYTFSRPVNVSRCRLGRVKTEVRRWGEVKEKDKTEEEEEEEEEKEKNEEEEKREGKARFSSRTEDCQVSGMDLLNVHSSW